MTYLDRPSDRRRIPGSHHWKCAPVAEGDGVAVGAAGLGGGEPDQAALLVGQGKEMRAMAGVLAGIVPPVGLAGAAPDGDEGAVDQDPLSSLLGGLAQGTVQARRLGGEPSDQLVATAADGIGTQASRCPRRALRHSSRNSNSRRWTLSRQVGQLRPDGVQRLLNLSDWDEEGS
ncbi:hypothetical protein ACWCZ5_23730 [Streptomyces sp. NPDC001667]